MSLLKQSCLLASIESLIRDSGGRRSLACPPWSLPYWTVRALRSVSIWSIQRPSKAPRDEPREAIMHLNKHLHTAHTLPPMSTSSRTSFDFAIWPYKTLQQSNRRMNCPIRQQCSYHYWWACLGIGFVEHGIRMSGSRAPTSCLGRVPTPMSNCPRIGNDWVCQTTRVIALRVGNGRVFQSRKRPGIQGHTTTQNKKWSLQKLMHPKLGLSKNSIVSCPSAVVWSSLPTFNNFAHVLTLAVQEIGQESNWMESDVELWFYQVKSLMQTPSFLLEAPNTPFHTNHVPDMHFVKCFG